MYSMLFLVANAVSLTACLSYLQLPPAFPPSPCMEIPRRLQRKNVTVNHRPASFPRA